MTVTRGISGIAGRSSTALLLAALLGAAACERAPDAPPALLNPDPAELARQAPDSFRVAFQTSAGAIVVQAQRAWAPHGVDRFYYLAKHGFFDGAKFFRAVPNFVVQFGLHGDPKVNAAWRERSIPDDSVRQSNQPGYLTFAMGGPNTRTTQLFFNRRDNARLDAMGFAPIAKIVEGQAALDSIYSEYGDAPPNGRGPDQEWIQSRGNAYLSRSFPLLDSIIRARVLED